MSPIADPTQDLITLALSYGIQLNEQQASLLLQHLHLLQEKNKQINLTRIVSTKDGLLRHILDSLLFLLPLDSHGIAKNDLYVDLGTGGGYPGIPLSIMLPCRSILVDSVVKKSKAVDEFLLELGLSDRVHTSSLRAEELAKEISAAASLVSARALAQLSVLIEYSSPLLKVGGLLISSKGRIESDEVNHALHVAPLCGMKLVSRETCELPLDQGHREIFTFEKIGKAKLNLPRHIGMAKNKPL